jgi:hypothetical protein
VGQLVEIPFRGINWVYLGELGNRLGIAYDSRRLDPEGQSFVFRAEAPGTYALKFYRQDLLRDYLLNDYVQVIVEEAPAISSPGRFGPAVDRGRVVAEPRWPTALDEAAARDRDAGAVPSLGGASPAALPASAGSAPGASAGSAQGAQNPASPVSADAGAAAEPGGTAEEAPAPAELSPGDYVSRARDEYNAGKIGEALASLGEFQQHYPAGSDEAWWLYGQLLEANSPNRDIRAALDYYRRLVREYPQSRWYAEARRRIAYLERYYINIQ